jgi:uncharacterized cupin superfamily protein
MARPKSEASLVIVASEVPPPQRQTNYPEPFASRMAGRVKRRLGDVFNLKNFGVNLTKIAPGGISSLRHSHSKQDEFVYVLAGTATLVTDVGEALIGPGECAGFPAGGPAHHLVNRTNADVVYLEIGDRSPSDQVTYPEDDLQAVLGADGSWVFLRKSGARV